MDARHICILFRRFISFGEDVTQPYVQALEARGVPHVLVGGKTFHDREEVETIRAALSAIEWPDDELSVFATLRGGLFAIGDEELLDWKQRFFEFHPFRIKPEAREAAHARADRRGAGAAAPPPSPQELRAGRRDHPGTAERDARARGPRPAECRRTGARQRAARGGTGAPGTEAAGGISFRGFVDELRRAAETAQSAEAPILEEGSDGVRMMTVHKAKGLEFPVVILADATCKLARAEAGRWLDAGNSLCALKLGGWAPVDLLLHDAEEASRDRAEAVRLTYVAATRARDILVVPAIGDGAYDGGWLDPLTAAVYPPEASRRAATRAAGCPEFKSKDSVMNRPDADPARPHTVMPGQHAFTGLPTPDPRTSPDPRAPSAEPRAPSAERRAPTAKYSVVWWDPHVLHLGAASSFGLRRDDPIVKDGDMFAVEDRRLTYERWRAERDAVVTAARQPSLRVQTATAWAASAAAIGIDEAIAERSTIEAIVLPGSEDRPRGPRFGTLVHAILATVPLDACDDLVRGTAEMHGRILLAEAGEVHAAATVVSSVLRSALMQRARAAAVVRRETPITWMQDDGGLIEGVLDLAFEEGEATIVVDFKTDHELAAGESRYRAQVQQYVNAVAARHRPPGQGRVVQDLRPAAASKLGASGSLERRYGR